MDKPILRRRILLHPFSWIGLLLCLSIAIPIAAQEKVDLATIERIETEAEQHSQVMDIASWLTDVFGPRLTGSPNAKAASDWAVETMRSWGLTNAHLEEWGPYDSGLADAQWGPFNRGWTSEQFTFRAITPRPFIINAMPPVGSPSTQGRVTGPATRFDVHSLGDMQRYAGKLKHAFLLLDPPRSTPAHFQPQARRLTAAELDADAAGQPLPRAPGEAEVTEIRYNVMDDAAALRWLAKEGVAALLLTSSGDGGMITMRGSAGTGLASVNLSAESYGRIVRILEKHIPVTLELEMQNTFYDDQHVFNVIAEISGADPKLKEEVVMLGAHLDSWTFGTGATDDGAGVAMTMEAMRILKALNLQPRRTIRIALWTGEEQGALGSNAYVQRHLRDWVRRHDGELSTTKAEYDSFSVYFNLDAGTGKIRGVHQAGNVAVGAIFDAWMGPFKCLGMKTVTLSDIGGGDNHAFSRVGLPSFGFIQDPIEYSRTAHTSADVFERLQPEDLQFNAAVVASFAWQAAQRNEKLPRSPRLSP